MLIDDLRIPLRQQDFISTAPYVPHIYPGLKILKDAYKPGAALEPLIIPYRSDWDDL